MRAVEEWQGKTDDAAVPPRVRLRIFERYEGKCYLSGIKIRPGDKWELEHIQALCNGGQHREFNMAPALVAPHKIKTKADRREKAKVDRLKKANAGIKKPRTITRWRRMNGDIVTAARER
jgi:5-methylcytosine-specific restriction protein A